MMSAIPSLYSVIQYTDKHIYGLGFSVIGERQDLIKLRFLDYNILLNFTHSSILGGIEEEYKLALVCSLIFSLSPGPFGLLLSLGFYLLSLGS